MQRKLTTTVSEDVYQGLHRVVRRRISGFLDQLARPHVVPANLNAAYQEMASDETREREAPNWSEALVGDVAGVDDVAR